MSDGHPTQRRRGRTLQTIRERWFRIHPLCVHCRDKGRATFATELDHIVPLHKGGLDDDTNRQGLCRRCHAAKTRIDRAWGPARGCDANGLPIDPDHPWNAPP
jgi:5-methylcytosine-specific restriction protein A